MWISRRRKRARKQTTIFRPELEEGRTSVTSGKPQAPRQRKTCSAEASSKAAPVTKIIPLKRKGTSECGEQLYRKKVCLGLNTAAEQNDESFGDPLHRGDGETTEENSSHTDIRISQALKKRGQYNFSSTSQLVGEDIQCGAISFLFLDSDAEGMREDDPRYLERFSDRPGVTKWEPNSTRSWRGSNTFGGNARQNVLYRSRKTYEGVSINLGNHKSSKAAAAAQDLANLALFGSDHRKDRHVLSRDEGWNALRAVSMPGARPFGQVDAFCSLLTEQRKAMFEQKIEEALSTIGGQDDFLADILSGVDYGAFSAAEEFDKVNEANHLEETKRVAKERARKRRKARQLEKKNRAGQTGNLPCIPKRAIVLPVDQDGFVFGGEHGTYGISELGNFFWKRDTGRVANLPSREGQARRKEVEFGVLSSDSLCHMNPIARAGQQELSPDAHPNRAPGVKGGNGPVLSTSSKTQMEGVECRPKPGGDIVDPKHMSGYCRVSKTLTMKDGIAKTVSDESTMAATLPLARTQAEKKAVNYLLLKTGGNDSKSCIIPDTPPSCDLKLAPARVISGLASESAQVGKQCRSRNCSDGMSRRGKRKSGAKAKISVVSRISVFQYSSGTESDSLDESSEQTKLDGSVPSRQQQSGLHSLTDQHGRENGNHPTLECSKEDPKAFKKIARTDERDRDVDSNNVAAFQIVSNMKIVPLSSSMGQVKMNTGFGFDSEVVLEVTATPSVDTRKMSVINKLSTHVSLTSDNTCSPEEDAAAPKLRQVKESFVTRNKQPDKMVSKVKRNMTKKIQACCTRNTVSARTKKAAMSANLVDATFDEEESQVREMNQPSSSRRAKNSFKSQDYYSSSKGSRRRRRCGECTNCSRDDCGKCVNCLDMVKFGGPNIKRQGCKQRKCVLLQTENAS